MVFEWSSIFRVFYPESIFVKYCQDKEETEKLCIQIIKFRFATLILSLIIFASIFLFCFSNFGCFIFEILLAFAFICLSKHDTPYYHGDLIKIRNIKNGGLILYLAKELCIYNTEKKIKQQIYEEVNVWILKLKNYEDYANFIATVVKHMLVEEYSLHTSFLKQETIDLIKLKTINCDEIKMGLVDESWELLKMYLAYSVINCNNVELNYIIKELRFLKMNLSSYVKKFADMMDWYIAIANIDANLNEQYRYPFLVSKDRFSDIAIDYKVALTQMESDVWSKMKL